MITWLLYGFAIVLVLFVIFLVIGRQVNRSGGLFATTKYVVHKDDVTKNNNNSFLHDKTVLLTGANTGLGYTTALGLLLLKVNKLYITCRTVKKGEATKKKLIAELIQIKSANNKAKSEMDEIIAKAKESVKVLALELSSFKSIRSCADEFNANEENGLNILINNAGIVGKKQCFTEDNYPIVYGVNHLGPFLLTQLLLPALIKGNQCSAAKDVNSRIVFVASRNADMPPPIKTDDIELKRLDLSAGTLTYMRAYSYSKLYNVMTCFKLHRVFQEQKLPLSVNVLHPGYVFTDVMRDGGILQYLHTTIGKFVAKDGWLGAQTTLLVAADEQIGNCSGSFYEDCHVATIKNKEAYDLKLQDLLYQTSQVSINK